MIREVSKSIVENLIGSARQLLTPDKLILNSLTAEILKLEKELQKKDGYRVNLLRNHIETFNIDLERLESLIGTDAFELEYERTKIWVGVEEIEFGEAKRERKKLAGELIQKKIAYDALYAVYCDKLRTYSDVLRAVGMSIGEMAIKLGDLVPDTDKISFFAALALPHEHPQANEG